MIERFLKPLAFFMDSDYPGPQMITDGVSPSGKAAVFGTAIRGFESFHPSHGLKPDKVVRSRGLEPLTPKLGILCSIHLSYERA